MLAEICENEITRDERDLVKTRFAELAPVLRRKIRTGRAYSRAQVIVIIGKGNVAGHARTRVRATVVGDQRPGNSKISDAGFAKLGIVETACSSNQDDHSSAQRGRKSSSSYPRVASKRRSSAGLGPQDHQSSTCKSRIPALPTARPNSPA